MRKSRQLSRCKTLTFLHFCSSRISSAPSAELSKECPKNRLRNECDDKYLDKYHYVLQNTLRWSQSFHGDGRRVASAQIALSKVVAGLARCVRVRDRDCQSVMKKIRVIAACVLGCGLLFLAGEISTRVYLKTHATGCGIIKIQSRGGKFQIAMYRYPRLRDIPETLGFGQGFLQLQEAASGKVIAQKRAQDLGTLSSYRWSETNVIIYQVPEMNEFAKWDLPQ